MTYKTRFTDNGVDISELYTSNQYYIDSYSSLSQSNKQPTLYGFVSYSFPSRSSPIQIISSFSDWKEISSGFGFIGIKTNNTLWAWGTNTYGQLGDGTVISRSSPVQIGSENSWRKISCGIGFTAAIKNNGTLWTWGNNDYGQLGINAIGSRSSPTQIGSETTWRIVSCSPRANTGASLTYVGHCAAIKNDGTLWTWGYNNSGELGDETRINRSSPIQVGSNTNWKLVSCGDRMTGAIKTDGTLWTWGSNGNPSTGEQCGKLGDNTIVGKSSPVQIGTDTNWSKLSCGLNHSGAIKTDGTLWMWGPNETGHLGDNSKIARSSPVQILGSNWIHVSCSFELTSPGLFGANNQTYAIKSDGSLWTWGYNQYGELGDNTTIHRSAPVQIGANNWITVQNGYAIKDELTNFYNDEIY